MKKVTILFGAGAAIPWNAPSTSAITEAIDNSTDHMVLDKTLGLWMKEQIRSRTGVNNPNFESYVDFLETIYYFLNEESPGTASVINPSGIFEMKPNVLEGLKNLGFQNESTFSTDAAKVGSCFYSLIRIIGNEIRRYYSSYTDGNNQLNWKLKYFVEHFIKIGYSVRSYTLNYDRSLPAIFENMFGGYEIFDGFDIQEHEAAPMNLFFCNKDRVLNDSECHCYYNLHGSIHWSFQECDYKTTNSSFPFILMSSREYNPPNAEFVEIEDYLQGTNPNEKLLQSKIITGYKKIQRINLEPFNYFFHNFFRDIHQSEVIIVIGYSYSDPHINQLLKDAIRRRTRVYNICLREKHLIENHRYSGFEGMILNNAFPDDTNWFRDAEFFFSEYPLGFEKFLQDEEWFGIQPV